MAKPHLALVTPRTIFGSVTRGRPPKRRRNAEARSREYLTASEVEQLIAAAGNNRYGHRDATMVLVAYRHGLRPAEAIALRWDAIGLGITQHLLNEADRLTPPAPHCCGVERFSHCHLPGQRRAVSRKASGRRSSGYAAARYVKQYGLSLNKEERVARCRSPGRWQAHFPFARQPRRIRC
jgi:Phage integrase family